MKIPPQAFAYLLITLIVLITLYFVFKKVGLISDLTREEKAAEKEAKKRLAEAEKNSDIAEIVIRTDEAFNPLVWQSTKDKSDLLNEPLARQFAGQIEDAIGMFFDDESKIYKVFRSLKNRSQVSQVSFYFASMFDRDLSMELANNLSNDELAIILDIVNNYKNE